MPLLSPAWATMVPGKRVALVIGNSRYVHVPTLSNPAADAALMAKSLREGGFQVVEGIDLTLRGMRDALDRFTEDAYDADIAMIYYAGHGMQIDGRNYLIPVDAELRVPAHIKTRTVEIDDFLTALPTDPAVGIIILDACRDNPLARTLAAAMPQTRSLASPGLAPVEVKGGNAGTGGLLIAYATDPDAVAVDGGGLNSPYTKALTRHLFEPGVEIQSALTRVRGDVVAETQGRQRPWHNASLGREIFLGGPAPAMAAASPVRNATAEPASAPPSDLDIELRIWDEATRRNTVAHYEAYLAQFPAGRFAASAKATIDQLKLGGGGPAVDLQPVPDTDTGATPVAPSAPPPVVIARTPRAIEAAPVLAPSPAPEVMTPDAIEAELALSDAQRIEVQRGLKALGYDLGADGKFGPKSRRAIALWQEKKGYDPTTFLTESQHLAILEETQTLRTAIPKVERAVGLTRPERPKSAERPQPKTDRNARNERKPRPAAVQVTPRPRKPDRNVKPERKPKPAAAPAVPRPSTPAARKPAPAKTQRFKTCRNAYNVWEVPVSKSCSASSS